VGEGIRGTDFLNGMAGFNDRKEKTSQQENIKSGKL
jgi:hypothetical protein